MTTRFATTHVGSLPRPEALLDLVFAREGGAAFAFWCVGGKLEAARKTGEAGQGTGAGGSEAAFHIATGKHVNGARFAPRSAEGPAAVMDRAAVDL